MKRQLHLLCAAAIVVGVSAAFAASASAAVPQFKAEKYPATIAGESINENIWRVGAGVRSMSCQHNLYAGALVSSSSQVSVEPFYSNCSAAPGGLIGKVEANGCKFQWEVTGSGPHFPGAESLSCPAGKTLEWSLYENQFKVEENRPLCSYAMSSQSASGAVSFDNQGSGASAYFEVSQEIGLNATVTAGSKILCSAGVGQPTTVHFSGVAKVIGKSEGKRIGTYLSAS